MPRLSELSAAPNVRHGKYPALFHPADQVGSEPGRRRPAKGAVSIEDQRAGSGSPIRLSPLAEKHRDPGAIPRLVEHLPSDELIRVVAQLGSEYSAAGSTFEVYGVERAGIGEVVQDEEGLSSIPGSHEPGPDRPDLGKRNVVAVASIQIEYSHPEPGLMPVCDDQVVA